jgi:1-phosphofructokinase family hexose kinase
MIVAAGLTPAWQQILEFDAFEQGAVNRARAVHWCASGKVLNVGLALQSLGARSRTVAVMGGTTGEAMAAEFAAQGATAEWVRSAAATRICTTILDRASRETTELVENAASLAAETLAQFDSVFTAACTDADLVILTGSLPAGTPTDCYRRLLQRVSCRTLLDVRGPELLQVLDLRPTVVKPNRHELAATFGRSLDSDAEVVDAMRDVNRLGAEWVVVTDGPRNVLATSADQTLRLSPCRVESVNPIACGDCLAAGLAVGLVEGRTIEDALRFGIAAAAHNAEQLLPSRLSRGRIGELERLVKCEQLSAARE